MEVLISDMQIKEITQVLEEWAHPSLQESYDNSGLLTGSPNDEVIGVLVCLDCTEEIITEAVSRKCNLIIAHHPIIFKGLKKINGKNYVERTIISAIKNDIAIYAIHTNLDNVLEGVSGRMASLLGLKNCLTLSPLGSHMRRISVYVPAAFCDAVSDALFEAGAGKMGNYSQCSFCVEGTGSFKPGEGSNPFAGARGSRHVEPELRLEMVFPAHLQSSVVAAMKKTHPYEEIAYGIFGMENVDYRTGAGVIGELESPVSEARLLAILAKTFGTGVIRHSVLMEKSVKKLAVCGGAGSFLVNMAIAEGADAFITADIKYHEFFDADGHILLADIGHFESEQFTIDLIFDKLTANFPNFAVLKTGISTNPVHYFTGL